MFRVRITRQTLDGKMESLVAPRFFLRVTWRQIALWRTTADGGNRAIFNWLNPLVWCWHGDGLHLRGKPIESAS